jgi:hypothetical protein
MSNHVYQYEVGVGTIHFDLSAIHVLESIENRIYDRNIIEEQCSLKGITNPTLIAKIKSLVNAGADLESILNAYKNRPDVRPWSYTSSRSRIKKEVVDWVKEGF